KGDQDDGCFQSGDTAFIPTQLLPKIVAVHFLLLMQDMNVDFFLGALLIRFLRCTVFVRCVYCTTDLSCGAWARREACVRLA
ncbi:MAG: hypothetical protein KA362_13995, partial [Chloroflexi bacterium]|nr:hypothetical protein [Chloroflexota bacterium]